MFNEYVLLQVCNAVYVRLNYTQPLCACPSRYKEPCSASLNADDLHTTELSTDTSGKVSKNKLHFIRIKYNKKFISILDTAISIIKLYLYLSMMKYYFD